MVLVRVRTHHLQPRVGVVMRVVVRRRRRVTLGRVPDCNDKLGLVYEPAQNGTLT